MFAGASNHLKREDPILNMKLTAQHLRFNTTIDNPFISHVKRVVKAKIKQRTFSNKEVFTRLSNIIPGFRYVVSTKRATILKIIWIMLILVSTILCFYQIIERIIYYFGEPVATNAKLETMTEVSFPLITLCGLNNQKAFNTKQKCRSGLLAGSQVKLAICLGTLSECVGQHSVEELWGLTNPGSHTKILLYERNRIVPAGVKTTIIHTPLGECLDISLDEKNNKLQYDGRQTRLVIERTDIEKGCNIFENVFIPHEEDDINFRALFFTGNPSDVDLTIKFKHFKRVNTKKKPCVSKTKSGECYMNCLYNEMTKAYTACRLPYMLKSDRSTPVCNTEKSTNECRKTTVRVAANLDPIKDCNCTRACEEKVFSLTRMINSLTGNDSRLTFYYPSNRYILIEEQLAYDFISLLCDVGGNLGLYLGLSIITVADLLESILQCAKKKRR